MIGVMAEDLDLDAVRSCVRATADQLTTDDPLASLRRRLLSLVRLARRDVALARSVEAHLDAVAILAEAGAAPHDGALYGVWASSSGGAGLRHDGRRLDGVRPFAGGARLVDRALVTATTDVGQVLLDVDVAGAHDDGAASTITVDDDWHSDALATTFTSTVRFDGHPAEQVVGPRPGWYLDRPGFWAGACAPAACWAGGAIGLIDVARRLVDDDPHRRSHLGGMLVHEWVLHVATEAAGSWFDDRLGARLDRSSRNDPDERPGQQAARRATAIAYRTSVADAVDDVLARFGRALGPAPMVRDRAVATRVADLALYVRQHHAERDLAALADTVMGDAAPGDADVEREEP